MKIVIDIPEGLFCRLQNEWGWALAENVREAIKNGTPLPEGHGRLAENVREAIKSGTILPKGHGRLIDADALIVSDEDCTRIGNCLECKMNVETCEHFKAVIENAPTIIEADKAESEDKE